MKLQKAKIGDVFEVETGSTPSTQISSYWENGTIKWITPKDLGELATRYISDTERKITKDGLDNSSAKLVPPGSIIISSRAPIGYLAVLTDFMAFNQGCKALVAKNTNQISLLYIYYRLQTKVKEMNALGSGSTFKEISKEKIENLQVILPPLSLQKQIAAILEKADAAREKRRQANQLTEQFLQSAFLEIFGDPVMNPKGWEVKKVGEVTDVKSGYAFKSGVYQTEGIRPVRISNFDNSSLILEKDSVFLPEKFAVDYSEFLLQEKDVLIAMSGATTGKLGMVSKQDLPCLLNQRVGRFTIIGENKLKAEYLFHFFWKLSQ